MRLSDLDLTMNDIRCAINELVETVGRLDNMTRQANEQAHRQTRELAEAREQVAELREWVADLQSGMYINCVYCGHRYGSAKDTPVAMAEVLRQHIEQCPEHPASKMRTRAERAEAKVNRLRAALREIVDGWTRSYTDKMRVTHRVCVFCGGMDGQCIDWCAKEELRAVLAETEESSDATDG